MTHCKFCSMTGFKQLKTHERQCKLNPNRTSAIGHKGKNHYTYGAICSPQTKQKISLSCNSRIISDETKKKISKARIKFLIKNPEMVPYRLNHSSTKSYPEKYFSECFANTKIVSEYPVGRYSLDFANVENKIYCEIDGEQHYLDNKIIESDKRRTDFLKNAGWTMIRVRWAEFQKLTNKKLFVENLKRIMDL